MQVVDITLLLFTLTSLVSDVAFGSVLRDTCNDNAVNECRQIPRFATDAARLMEYRNLGRSGLLVSRLSFGAWITFGNFSDDHAYELMRLCLDAGINFFDNAEAYHDGLAEEVMGRALKRLESEYPLPRSRLVLSTKIFFGTERGSSRPGRWVPNSIGLSRKHIIEGLSASLVRLQVDYVDVVFAHRPDSRTPMEEVVRGFNFVIDKGMALYWCTSEWSAEQIEDAWHIADRLGLVGPVCEQPQYSMLHRRRFESEYLPLYQHRGMGTTIWSSLSSGVLTGKYNDGIPPDSRLAQTDASYILNQFKNGKRHADIGGWSEIIRRVSALSPIAESINCTMAQLAIAWCLRNHDVTTVILGATKQSQLADNFGALSCATRLDNNVLHSIEEVLKNAPVAGQTGQEPTIDWNPNPTAAR